MARLLFFGALGDVMGRESALPLPPSVGTAQGLFDHLCSADDAFADAAARMKIRIAVNEAIVAGDAAISETDEIAFLPPFSGG